jgi:hypothetical protein
MSRRNGAGLSNDPAPPKTTYEDLMTREGLPPHLCSHAAPVLIEPTGDVHRARCLACNAIGPERETSERAYAALIALSKPNGEEE